MKFISWNVNGIRSVLKKGFMTFLKRYDPDVLCLQETRAMPEDVNLELPQYDQFWNPAQKKGYSGTAIFTKIKPRKTFLGMGIAKHDNEGRVLTAEFQKFILVNVYTPNAKRGLERLDYRYREWDVDFLKYLKKLERKKPVIFCGDLNVAHQEIDLANPRANRRNHGFTDEERRGFENFMKQGFIDTFRFFCSEGGHYSWWSQLHNARTRNIGWRIDYFCVSSALKKRLRSAAILTRVMGSDHAPVSLEIEL